MLGWLFEPERDDSKQMAQQWQYAPQQDYQQNAFATPIPKSESPGPLPTGAPHANVIADYPSNEELFEMAQEIPSFVEVSNSTCSIA